MGEKIKSCPWCGAPLGECDCGYLRSNHKSLKQTQVTILEVKGSQGLESCGRFENGPHGLNPSASAPENPTIGGTKEYTIAPGTLRSFFPFSLFYKLFPGKIPKNPRNLDKSRSNH